MECLRIYADESGESHLADIDIPLVPMELSPFHFSAPYAASSVRFVWAPAEYRKPVGTSHEHGNSSFY